MVSDHFKKKKKKVVVLLLIVATALYSMNQQSFWMKNLNALGNGVSLL